MIVNAPLGPNDRPPNVAGPTWEPSISGGGGRQTGWSTKKPSKSKAAVTSGITGPLEQFARFRAKRFGRVMAQVGTYNDDEDEG